jgi:phosphoglycolate phosphatase
MKKIVIFDMDGTLIDSKKDMTISVNYVRKVNHNLPPLSEDFIVNAINKEHRNLSMLFYNTQTYEKRDQEVFEKHYKQQCIEHPYLFDGILELLQTLQANNVKMSVATNAPTKFAKTMLSHLNILDMFDVVIGADKVKVSKPDPEMIHHILSFYDFDPEIDKAWMIGDTLKDVESALNAGIQAIFSTWGFTTHGTYEVVAEHPKDILDIVL